MPDPVKHAYTDDEFDELGFDDPDFYGDLTQEEKNWGLVAHVSPYIGTLIPFGNFIAPLVVMLTQRDRSDFIGESAKEALNFQITVAIAAIVFGILSFALIGLPFLIAVGVAWLVMPVLAAIRSSEGELYRYPWILRLVK